MPEISPTEVVALAEVKYLMWLVAAFGSAGLFIASMWMRAIHADLKALKSTLTRFVTQTALQGKDIESNTKEIAKVRDIAVGAKGSAAAAHTRMDKYRGEGTIPSSSST